MEQRVLIPLDGSEASEAILLKLDNLLFKEIRRSDVEITLLRVMPIVNFNVLTTDERAQLPYNEVEKKEMTQNAMEYLAKIAGTLKSKGFKVDARVKTGPAAEKIVETAHEIKAGLIAMSTHGENRIIRWAKGSIAEKVMKLEHEIPVLAINPYQKDDKNPILPIDSLQSLIKHV